MTGFSVAIKIHYLMETGNYFTGNFFSGNILRKLFRRIIFQYIFLPGTFPQGTMYIAGYETRNTKCEYKLV